MTNTPEQPEVDEQYLKDDLNQIKTEGRVRLNRIAQILRTAFAQSTAELKGGASAVNPATQNVRASVTQLIRAMSQETLAKAKQVWANRARSQSPGWRGWFRTETQAATRAMRATLSESRRTARAQRGKAVKADEPDAALVSPSQNNS